MGETLTEELHFLNRRMKQKLMFQIGLTDEQWMEKDDFIEDDIYS